MTAYIPLSSITVDSRAPETAISFSGGVTRTWDDFTRNLASLRGYIDAAGKDRWIINSDDIYWFLCAFVATIQCGKEALLCANTTPSFLSEIRDASTGFLCGQNLAGSTRIQELAVRHLGSSDHAFPPIAANDARISLYTSGSTGTPKAFPKRLTELEAETGELYRLWGGSIAGKKIYSTVNTQHIYGLLFAALLPLSAGVPVCADVIRYPESLESLGDPGPVLVCSPAFFKRVVETKFSSNPFPLGPMIFSSGGVLSVHIAREILARLGSSPLEIYGSTETGGIAYRKSVEESAWRPFSRHTVTINEDGRIVVKSPYILDPEGFVSGDLGHFVEEGRFLLDGRADSIVKIEEKRVSLTEVETRICDSSYAKEACVIPLEGRRQYLGAVVALSEEGRLFFEGKDKRELNSFFRDHLSQFLESTVIPKKWRFVESIPRNPQDKILRDKIKALFAKAEEITVYSISKTECKLVLEISVGEESVFFDGHFPSFKLLPGVVQFDLAMRYAAEHLALSSRIKSISRMKFRRPIPPETRLSLSIDFNPAKKNIVFSYANAETGEAFSEGSIVLEST